MGVTVDTGLFVALGLLKQSNIVEKYKVDMDAILLLLFELLKLLQREHVLHVVVSARLR